MYTVTVVITVPQQFKLPHSGKFSCQPDELTIPLHPRNTLDRNEPLADRVSFSVEAMVRGYHTYMYKESGHAVICTMPEESWQPGQYFRCGHNQHKRVIAAGLTEEDN